jgi:glycosyltransferase involved in cell wall biosynthesis
MLHIAVLSDGIFPFTVGGMQKHTTSLVKHFAQKGIRVSLFASFPTDFDMVQIEQVFDPKELMLIKITNVQFKKTARFPGHYIYRSYQQSKSIFTVLKEELSEIDFIYAQGFTAWYTLKKAKKIKFPPIAVNFHGLEMYQYTFGFKNKIAKYIFRPFVKRNIRMANVYFSLGKRLSGIVKSIAPKTQIIEIPVAVDASWFNNEISPTERTNACFIFIGRYERRKGLEELMEAVNLLKYPCTISFVGAIPPQIQNQLVNKSQATFHGQIINEQEIKALLRKHDVLVCPSYAEGMPTVIIEAMANNLSILATDVGAVDELVNNSNGWIIRPVDVYELKERMEEILKMDKNSLEQKKTVSRKRANFYNWDRVIDQTIKEIREIIGRS